MGYNPRSLGEAVGKVKVLNEYSGFVTLEIVLIKTGVSGLRRK